MSVHGTHFLPDGQEVPSRVPVCRAAETPVHTEVLELLLKDHTTQQNIFWATDSYASRHLGLYQLYETDKIPASAAVNESVVLAKKYCKNPKAASLVNAGGIHKIRQQYAVRPQTEMLRLRKNRPALPKFNKFSHDFIFPTQQYILPCLLQAFSALSDESRAFDKRKSP